MKILKSQLKEVIREVLKEAKSPKFKDEDYTSFITHDWSTGQLGVLFEGSGGLDYLGMKDPNKVKEFLKLFKKENPSQKIYAIVKLIKAFRN